MRKSLTKQEIIRNRTDIDHLFKAGKRYSFSCFKLYVAPNGLLFSRMIVIPVKHYGNAVQRNHIRRQVKEIWRNHSSKVSTGFDYSFLVYPGKALSYEEKEKSILLLLEKSNSLIES